MDQNDYDGIRTRPVITDGGEIVDLIEDLTDEQRDRLRIAYPTQKAAMLLGITETQLDDLHEGGEIVIRDVGEGERIVLRTEIDRYRATRGQEPV